MSKYRQYFSHRDLPLVYTGPPPVAGSMTRGIATIENYIKWYHVYVVMPNGEVNKLDVELWDHLVPPNTVFAVEDIGYMWDEVSLEVIIGRWYSEQHVTKFQRS